MNSYHVGRLSAFLWSVRCFAASAFRWREPVDLFEYAVEIRNAVEPRSVCYCKDRIIGLLKKLVGFFEPACVNVAAEAAPGLFLEKASEILFVIMEELGDVRQINIKFQIILNIAFDIVDHRMAFRLLGLLLQKHADCLLYTSPSPRDHG